MLYQYSSKYHASKAFLSTTADRIVVVPHHTARQADSNSGCHSASRSLSGTRAIKGERSRALFYFFPFLLIFKRSKLKEYQLLLRSLTHPPNKKQKETLSLSHIKYISSNATRPSTKTSIK